jgi:hypothetical protein
MKVVLSQLQQLPSWEQGEPLAVLLHEWIDARLPQWQDDFVQDLSHISTAAVYAGNIRVEQVVFLQDNLYRCDYAYDWQIGWTCSGTQEAGRVQEKVRFRVLPQGELQFQFLKLEL